MKYRAVVIGTGRIGYLLQKDKKREQPASHSSAIAANKHLDLVAGCDIDSEKLGLWQKDYPRAGIYSSATELMLKECPDIVAIAVSEQAHLEVTLTVIKQKPKLIILEKPVSPNLREAKKIARACQKYNVPVCINHERRFSEDYRLAKELIKKQEIGELHAIYAHLWSGNTVWEKSCKKDGSCALIHDGTHLLDILHFMLEEKLNKPNFDKIIKNKKGKVISLFLHYHLTKNKILYLDISGNKSLFDFDIDFHAQRGRLKIGNGYFKLYKRAPSPYYTGFYSLKRDKRFKRPQKTGYFSNMVNNCVAFLDGKEDLISPLKQGILSLKVLYKIVEKL